MYNVFQKKSLIFLYTDFNSMSFSMARFTTALYLFLYPRFHPFISNIAHISVLCNYVTGGDSLFVATQAVCRNLHTLLRGKDERATSYKVTPQLCLFHVLPMWLMGSVWHIAAILTFLQLHTGSVKHR